MPSSIALAAIALLTVPTFASVHHLHQHAQYHNVLQQLQERSEQNNTCYCTTTYSTYYGEPTLVQAMHEAPVTTSSFVAPPSPTSSSSSSEYHAPSPSPKPYHAPAPPPAQPKPAPYHAPKPAAAPKAAVSKPKQKSSSPPSPPASSGNQWCMTYSPYTSNGACKDAGAVASDIEAIASKGFSSIRLYSTDCSGLSNAGSAAANHGLKLVLGVFVNEAGIEAAKPQIGEISSWAKSTTGGFSNVEMIVIGNEAIFNNYCTAEELASFITAAKSELSSAGYTGPITTTETLNVLTQHASTLCPALDALAANIHPFFNPAVSASEAGSFVAKELETLAQVCPGKQMEAYNLETGWPHTGSANGVAVPGQAEQQEAIMAIKDAAGGKSVFFSFVDDLWKHEGEFGVEQSWGCSQLFGN